jgi:voltage-gated potassium channel
VLRFVRADLENDRSFNYDLSPRQVSVVELLMLIFVILTVHAGVIHGLESEVNPGFQNFGDTMYYSVVSLTTTGFGETTPVTDAGKFAIFFGLIAAVTLIPRLLVRARNKPKTETVCERCNTSKHLKNPNYCWKCGKQLKR